MSFREQGEHLRIALHGAEALFTTRRGGVSAGPYASLNLGGATDDDPDHVARNRERALALTRADALALGRQVHGARIAVDGAGGDADGQVTTRAGLAAAVLVADCLPVALAGDGVVAMLHAGWRGLAAGVLEAGVAALNGGAVAAAIGPGIGPCCYAVGPEVHAALGTSGATIDLKAIARARLAAAGVGEVHDCHRCTACEPERFFSHRRDAGVTGRQAGIAWLS